MIAKLAGFDLLDVNRVLLGSKPCWAGDRPKAKIARGLLRSLKKWMLQTLGRDVTTLKAEARVLYLDVCEFLCSLHGRQFWDQYGTFSRADQIICAYILLVPTRRRETGPEDTQKVLPYKTAISLPASTARG